MKKLFLLLLVTSCSGLPYIPTIRTPFELKTHNGYIISNIYTDPTKLEKTDKGVKIFYDITLKNTLDQVRDIDLEKAEALSKDQALPMACLNYKKKERYFKVMANETFRIQCLTLIPSVSKPRGDSKFILSIPLSGQPAQFSYIVRAEELQ